MVDVSTEIVEWLGTELVVLFMSMLPVVELRGAILVGIAMGLAPFHSTVISFVGSMILVPFILSGIRPVFGLMRRTRFFRGLVGRITARSLNKHAHRIGKYGVLGLIILVAIPLPGTGVWSGSLAAALLDVRFRWAFPAILVGNLIAAVIIMSLSNAAATVLGG